MKEKLEKYLINPNYVPDDWSEYENLGIKEDLCVWCDRPHNENVRVLANSSRVSECDYCKEEITSHDEEDPVGIFNSDCLVKLNEFKKNGSLPDNVLETIFNSIPTCIFSEIPIDKNNNCSLAVPVGLINELYKKMYIHRNCADFLDDKITINLKGYPTNTCYKCQCVYHVTKFERGHRIKMKSTNKHYCVNCFIIERGRVDRYKPYSCENENCGQSIYIDLTIPDLFQDSFKLGKILCKTCTAIKLKNSKQNYQLDLFFDTEKDFISEYFENLGKLSKEEIMSLIKPLLDDRFLVVNKEANNKYRYYIVKYFPYMAIYIEHKSDPLFDNVSNCTINGFMFANDIEINNESWS